MAIYQRVLDYQWAEGLSAAEQQRVLAQLDEALKLAGGMRIVMAHAVPNMP